MKNNKKGFTLIELIVVMALMALVFSMGFTIYRFSTEVYQRGSGDTLTQADLRTGISVITKDIRKHPNETLSASGSTITIGSNTYTVNLDGELTVNNQVFLSGIESFETSSSGNTITIKITSLPDDLGRNYSYETTITRR